jgi:transcriptional regulator with XRE-family HTH domain
MNLRVRDDVKSVIRWHGLTIADVARAANVSYAHVSAVLNGRCYPSKRVAAAISAAIGVDPAAAFADVMADDKACADAQRSDDA